jgi:hypothetical protein
VDPDFVVLFDAGPILISFVPFLDNIFFSLRNYASKMWIETHSRQTLIFYNKKETLCVAALTGAGSEKMMINMDQK